MIEFFLEEKVNLAAKVLYLDNFTTPPRILDNWKHFVLKKYDFSDYNSYFSHLSFERVTEIQRETIDYYKTNKLLQLCIDESEQITIFSIFDQLNYDSLPLNNNGLVYTTIFDKDNHTLFTMLSDLLPLEYFAMPLVTGAAREQFNLAQQSVNFLDQKISFLYDLRDPKKVL